MARDKDDPWRNFPKTAVERRLATEEDCGAYWIAARWGGRPACARCGSERVWPERGGLLFECVECDRQTSLTPGTVLEETRTPFKMWFCAIFEISSRKNGISAKELQRIMGFGSTAWSWLHKLRAAMVRPGRLPLGEAIQIDEGFVGGRRGEKAMVLVATETTDSRVRLAHANNNDAETLERLADANAAPKAEVTTDGHAGYNAKSLGDRPHEAHVQTPAERRERDTLQGVHWTMSHLKRWLLGTHGGAVSGKHLQAYLDEFAFRYNRRKTNGVARIAATRPFRAFPELTA